MGLERLRERDVGATRATWIAVAAFALLVVWLAASLNLGVDEVGTLRTTSGDAGSAFHQAIGYEAQAPLFFVLFDLWGHLGRSVLFLRTFSIVCVLATTPVVWRLAIRFAPSLSPAWAVAAFLFNPWTIWAALEMRLYALLVLLSALFLWAAAAAYLDDARDLQKRALAVGIACLGMWTQYYFVALVIGVGAGIIAARRTALLRYVVDMSLVALLSLPLVAFVRAQIATYQGATPTASGNRFRGLWLVRAVLGYVLPRDWASNEFASRARELAYDAATAVLVLALAASRPALEPGVRFLLATVAGACAVFYAVVAFAGVTVIGAHTLVLFVPALFAALALVAATGPRRRMPLFGAYLALFALFASATLWQRYAGMAKEGDAERVAAYVAQVDRDGEPFLAFDADFKTAIAYYYRGDAPLAAVPREQSRTAWTTEALRFRDEADVRSAFERLAKGGPLWFAEIDRCRWLGPYFGCRFLDDYIAAHYTVTSTRPFVGMSVRHLAPRT